jgi:hypothetical protein
MGTGQISGPLSSGGTMGTGRISARGSISVSEQRFLGRSGTKRWGQVKCSALAQMGTGQYRARFPRKP